jgi:hypothetical protein
MQSFFHKKAAMEEIQTLIGEVLKRNREQVAAIGTNGVGTVRATIDGVVYQLRVNRGRIGQFFSL